MSQEEAFNLAMYTCRARFPVDTRTQKSEWSQEQVAAEYEYVTTWLIPCLKRLGANPPDAPSLAVYMADPPTSWEYPDPGSEERQELW